ncbi:hypothetical protein D3C72_2525810 [compost metagenome]
MDFLYIYEGIEGQFLEFCAKSFLWPGNLCHRFVHHLVQLRFYLLLHICFLGFV